MWHLVALCSCTITQSSKIFPLLSVLFKYEPPAALPVTTIADVIRNKKQGDTITVSGTVKWNGDSKPQTTQTAKYEM